MSEASKPSREGRAAVIRAVTTPLNFMVLGLLVIEGVNSALVLAVPRYQGALVWTEILLIPGLLLVVVCLAVFRPEALSGNRPLQAETAHRLGSDLYLALEGALRSLEPSERSEALIVTIEILKNDDEADATHKKFCIAVAERLEALHGREYLRLQNAPRPGIKKS